MGNPLSEETARGLRRLWFDYLDVFEPVRPKLYRYCLKLSGSVFDAEDLVQDTLLRGFGSIGRADMSPPHDPGGPTRRWYEKPDAYLAQIATNLWIDRRRRAERETLAPEIDSGSEAPRAVVTRSVPAKLYARTAPQERAAIVLKDVFDLSLEEIASVLSTTTGAVKSALSRGREKLESPETMPARNNPASEETIDRFIEAWNSRDRGRLVALLLESVKYEPLGVGGEKGTKNAIWIDVPRGKGVMAERYTIEDELIVAFTFTLEDQKYLAGIERLEEVDGRISRIITYHFCPDTIAAVAREIGIKPWSHGYHQEEETLKRMVAGAELPWGHLPAA
jgi:RNA polymerase sigma-70 factor (ECF subfamily)